jgi:CRP-like cAMP-binding protein
MNIPPIEFGFLANVPLLAGLTPEDFSQLVEFTETRRYESGETLFLKGDPGGVLIVVIEGEVELFIYDDNNRRLVLSQVGSGGFFGEITLFDSSPRTTNALATKPTRIMLLRREVMVTFLQKYPDASIHIINVLSRRLRDTTDLATSNGGNAFDMLQESSNVWERLADRLSALVGSWPYLAMLITLIVIWVVISVLSDPENNIPGPIDGMGIVITMVGALQLPLILMSQNRQDKFEKIQADLDHDVNVKAQLSILEVNRKLDWLQESMMHQAQRLDKLEADHLEPGNPPNSA